MVRHKRKGIDPDKVMAVTMLIVLIAGLILIMI